MGNRSSMNERYLKIFERERGREKRKMEEKEDGVVGRDLVSEQEI